MTKPDGEALRTVGVFRVLRMCSTNRLVAILMLAGILIAPIIGCGDTEMPKPVIAPKDSPTLDLASGQWETLPQLVGTRVRIAGTVEFPGKGLNELHADGNLVRLTFDDHAFVGKAVTVVGTVNKYDNTGRYNPRIQSYSPNTVFYYVRVEQMSLQSDPANQKE